MEMINLTKNIHDQGYSQLCVPISVTNLIRHAMEYDMGFDKKDFSHTFENILSSITMVIYPRSMAGLNLNPKRNEVDTQLTDIESLLKRICFRTFIMPSGWEIIRCLGAPGDSRPTESKCIYKKGNFPISYTGF
jgi:hypothetical protein